MNLDFINDLAAQVPPELAPAVRTVVGVVVIVVFGLVAAVTIRFVLRRVEGVMLSGRLLALDDRREHAKRVSTLLGLVRTIALTLNWAIVLVMVLSFAGLDVTPILASAGILGLAVGFGAQNLVRDVISGFFHILENQVRVGDVVRINGIGGLVEQITYRIIVLRDLEQAVHVVPHGRVETLTNLTKDVSAMLLDVGVAYRENPDVVIAALREIAEEMSIDPEWRGKLLEPLEVLGLERFDDSAVVFRVRYKTLPIEQWVVRREFQRRLKIGFDRRGIEFPFPHRTLFVGEGSPALPVRVLAETPEGDVPLEDVPAAEASPADEPPEAGDAPAAELPANDKPRERE